MKIKLISFFMILQLLIGVWAVSMTIRAYKEMKQDIRDNKSYILKQHGFDDYEIHSLLDY